MVANSRTRPFAASWEVVGRRRAGLWNWLTPPRMFSGSFLVLILGGTLGFKYLPGLYTGQPLSWLDALFTSTSAVCVTGLVVVDTATYFTPLGQAWILLLIQLGGLGMLAFSSIIIVALGRRLSLRHDALSSPIRAAAPHLDIRRLTVDILRFTLAFEAAGALLLYCFWIPRLGWRGAAWPAVFHSVSAFCNAGFSTYSDNLVGFQSAPLTLSVIMILVVAGGLGFLTLEEVYLRYRAGREHAIFRISLHSRIVLGTTCALILGGWILFATFETDRTLRHLPIWHQAMNSLFLSVTPRTAGFNTIDYGLASDSTNFLTIILMMIGGSPGSTAGGIKTTTFALIGILAWSRLRGLESTNFASRSIREETTERAIGLFVVSVTMVTSGIFVLTATQGYEGRFLNQMFEVTSGFNTVGLSMGTTSTLNDAGRILMVLLMYLGRVGPLTIGAAIAVRQFRQGRFRYAYEEVVVG